jgi:hypothetical protein
MTPADPLMFSIRCWVVGDDASRSFTVHLPSTSDVASLKRVIKREKQPRLDQFAADDLDIWATAIPLVSGAVSLNENGDWVAHDGPQPDLLAGGQLLGNVKAFHSLDPSHLHVIVSKPEGRQYDSRPMPSATTRLVARAILLCFVLYIISRAFAFFSHPHPSPSKESDSYLQSGKRFR